jgi:hypothetical protein
VLGFIRGGGGGWGPGKHWMLGGAVAVTGDW